MTRSTGYSYDAMGNRSSAQASGTLTGSYTSSYNANKLNQLTSYATTSNGSTTTRNLSYDLSGNLTRQTLAGGSSNGGITYSYDEADRLTQVVRANENTGVNEGKSEFVYDAFSRKVINREFTWTNGAWSLQGETRRVYDGLDVVQERDASNAITVNYTRDGNIGGLLARSTSSGHFYYHYDGSGNVMQLTDAAQATVADYKYDAYGNLLSSSGAQSGQPYRFSTKEYHSATGLYDYGFRFYSPALGRWINRDPIKERGGLNLYGFVENNPSNAVDLYGLSQDMGGPSGTVRFSWTAYIPYGQVTGPDGSIFRGDGRGPSPDSKRYRCQINGRIDLKNHNITFDYPDTNPTHGIGGRASRYQGQATYNPRHPWFKTPGGYRLTLNGVSRNPFYTGGAVGPGISHNITIDFDNNGNILGVHGVRSGFPSQEFWTYRNGRAPHLGYNFDVRAIGRTNPWYLANPERF